MKTKFIPFVILTLVILIPLLLLLFDFGSIDFSLNFQKIYSYKVDDVDFDFYGSFGTVRKIKVKKNGSSFCSLNFYADADVFSDDVPAVETLDLNGDGKNDLLVLHGVDVDGDEHRSLFMATDSNYILAKDTDIVNFRIEDEKLISEESSISYLAETLKEYTVPNRRYVERRDYEFVDGEIIVTNKFSLSYYSETDTYCLSVYKYDETYHQLLCVTEDWMTPSEYLEKKENSQKFFKIQLP